MKKEELVKELERLKKAQWKEYTTRGNTQKSQELFARCEEIEKQLNNMEVDTMVKSQDIYNKLDKMELSQAARDFIAQCDQGAIIDLFEDINTPEEVEAAVKEWIKEDKED